MVCVKLRFVRLREHGSLPNTELEGGGGRVWLLRESKIKLIFTERSEITALLNRRSLPGAPGRDMRFFLWSVAPYVLALLSYLSQCATAAERHYYIAAVNINWDYTTTGAQRYFTFSVSVQLCFAFSYLHDKKFGVMFLIF